MQSFISSLGTQEESDANTSGVDSNNIPITEEEYDALVKYTPQENEWPDEPYDAAVARLTRGLSLISELPFAGPFAYPVDVRAYPDYWSVVAYPVDLKAIIDRLGNNYYRYRCCLSSRHFHLRVAEPFQILNGTGSITCLIMSRQDCP